MEKENGIKIMTCYCTNGKIFAHVNYGGGEGEWTWITCPDCKGTGEVPDEWETWKEPGSHIRYWRYANDFNIRWAADMLDVGIVELSSAENGKIDPSEIIKKIEAKGYTLPECLTCPECGGTEFRWVEGGVLPRYRICVGCGK